MKSIRIGIGSICCGIGILFFILPGSILFLIGGLVLLSYDIPQARKWLAKCQSAMSSGARRLDNIITKRKRSRY
ncbi:tellurium resistance protein TerC [Alteromonas sp. a30]|uniref:tellurium resistance protein TerC n=1 Tax=Alteromonas sp. a30 TaxID=2730917 RepID=UPI00227F7563|nr:tellurium resistance protein TerC [Alteromonas sp. a30]MCY7293987.1 tellurium resistance protein TerC [Alteromonas sp. a30]